MGRTLYSKKERKQEHQAFLEWLLATITEEEIDLLLIAGDVFDTATPGSGSQKLYYDFLVKVRQSGCKNVIVVGGNHDSPSFLNAPKDILAALRVTVIGHSAGDLEDEIIVIKDDEGTPVLMVCGVPFLRERDLVRFTEGENYADRSKRINAGIQKHYAQIAALAVEKRAALSCDIPIIATGHLSVAGGKRNDDDGVRETYIGTIEAVGSDIFPEAFDYVALGHYHVPSKIKEHIRYCGSPIPMGFGEADQSKCVYMIRFEGGARTIETIRIPVFQRLASVRGNKESIRRRLETLKNEGDSVWVEITYTGEDLFPDFSQWVAQQTENTSIEVLKLQNRFHLNEALAFEEANASLEDFDVEEVFERLLEHQGISEEQKEELREAYKEIVDGLNITD